MTEMTRRFDILSTPASADTVRCVLRNGERLLLLQKATDSKNKQKWELPGGKIDGVIRGTSSLAQQQNAVREEVLQETRIDISEISLGEPVNSFSYRYIVQDTPWTRTVHQFDVRLPEGKYDIRLNETLKEDGSPEDKHASSRWVTFKEYDKMRREGQIATSSMYVDPVESQ